MCVCVCVLLEGRGCKTRHMQARRKSESAWNDAWRKLRREGGMEDGREGAVNVDGEKNIHTQAK